MKIKLLITFLFLGEITNAQGTWTQKADFGGTARCGAIGFAIGTKGYIGTGDQDNPPYYTQDLWEWDQITNVWTQKADFPAGIRCLAVGFSIGNKGYIGAGHDTSINSTIYKKDFWEWDQSTNIWTQKANFGGTARDGAIGFSIGTKGYIGTGWDGACTQDFWEWDQATNAWTQKANFGGTSRKYAVGFSINSKGYIGTGADSTTGGCQDFWEWDQMTNAWTQKANFGGTARYGAIGFSIGTKGYIGTGNNWGIPFTDFLEWNQTTNVWTQKATFGGIGREYAVGFSINSKGYIGTGCNVSKGFSYQDFWEYSDSTETLINEIKNKISVSVFPNPSTGIFRITSDELRITNIEIINVMGEKVYEQAISNKGTPNSNSPNGLSLISINLSSQPKGIYFYTLRSENKNPATGKIIIQ